MLNSGWSRWADQKLAPCRCRNPRCPVPLPVLVRSLAASVQTRCFHEVRVVQMRSAEKSQETEAEERRCRPAVQMTGTNRSLHCCLGLEKLRHRMDSTDSWQGHWRLVGSGPLRSDGRGAFSHGHMLVVKPDRKTLPENTIKREKGIKITN